MHMHHETNRVCVICPVSLIITYTAVQPLYMKSLQKIQWDTCHQMASLALRFYKIQFRPGLCRGTYDAPPKPLVGWRRGYPRSHSSPPRRFRLSPRNGHWRSLQTQFMDWPLRDVGGEWCRTRRLTHGCPTSHCRASSWPAWVPRWLRGRPVCRQRGVTQRETACEPLVRRMLPNSLTLSLDSCTQQTSWMSQTKSSWTNVIVSSSSSSV